MVYTLCEGFSWVLLDRICMRRDFMKEYVNVIKYAMAMEKQGYEFFEQNANKMTLPSAKEMFLKLAELEQRHYDFLKEQLDHLEVHQQVKEVLLELESEKHIFADRAKAELLDHTIIESMAPDLTVLRTAYLMEKDFADFYREAAKNAAEPMAKRLFETLSLWEEGHEELFKAEYERNMKEFMNQPWGG